MHRTKSLRAPAVVQGPTINSSRFAAHLAVRPRAVRLVPPPDRRCDSRRPVGARRSPRSSLVTVVAALPGFGGGGALARDRREGWVRRRRARARPSAPSRPDSRERISPPTPQLSSGGGRRSARPLVEAGGGNRRAPGATTARDPAVAIARRVPRRPRASEIARVSPAPTPPSPSTARPLTTPTRPPSFSSHPGSLPSPQATRATRVPSSRSTRGAPAFGTAAATGRRPGVRRDVHARHRAGRRAAPLRVGGARRGDPPVRGGARARAMPSRVRRRDCDAPVRAQAAPGRVRSEPVDTHHHHRAPSPRVRLADGAPRRLEDAGGRRGGGGGDADGDGLRLPDGDAAREQTNLGNARQGPRGDAHARRRRGIPGDDAGVPGRVPGMGISSPSRDGDGDGDGDGPRSFRRSAVPGRRSVASRPGEANRRAEAGGGGGDGGDASPLGRRCWWTRREARGEPRVPLARDSGRGPPLARDSGGARFREIAGGDGVRGGGSRVRGSSIRRRRAVQARRRGRGRGPSAQGAVREGSDEPERLHLRRRGAGPRLARRAGAHRRAVRRVRPRDAKGGRRGRLRRPPGSPRGAERLRLALRRVGFGRRERRARARRGVLPGVAAPEDVVHLVAFGRCARASSRAVQSPAKPPDPSRARPHRGGEDAPERLGVVGRAVVEASLDELGYDKARARGRPGRRASSRRARGATGGEARDRRRREGPKAPAPSNASGNAAGRRRNAAAVVGRRATEGEGGRSSRGGGAGGGDDDDDDEIGGRRKGETETEGGPRGEGGGGGVRRVRRRVRRRRRRFVFVGAFGRRRVGARGCAEGDARG